MIIHETPDIISPAWRKWLMALQLHCTKPSHCHSSMPSAFTPAGRTAIGRMSCCSQGQWIRVSLSCVQIKLHAKHAPCDIQCWRSKMLVCQSVPDHGPSDAATQNPAALHCSLPRRQSSFLRIAGPISLMAAILSGLHRSGKFRSCVSCVTLMCSLTGAKVRALHTAMVPSTKNHQFSS